MFGIVFIQKGIQCQIRALKTNVWLNCHLLRDHGNCCLLFQTSSLWRAVPGIRGSTRSLQLEHRCCASGWQRWCQQSHISAATVAADELSHTPRAAEKPSPRLLMCCDRTMCICPNNVKFRCEELSWPMALTECHPGAAGIWPANRFQGDTKDGKHLMSPQSPPPLVCRSSQRPLLPSLLAPGSDTRERPRSCAVPSPWHPPQPLGITHFVVEGGAHPSPYLTDHERQF